MAGSHITYLLNYLTHYVILKAGFSVNDTGTHEQIRKTNNIIHFKKNKNTKQSKTKDNLTII